MTSLFPAGSQVRTGFGRRGDSVFAGAREQVRRGGGDVAAVSRTILRKRQIIPSDSLFFPADVLQ